MSPTQIHIGQSAPGAVPLEKKAFSPIQALRSKNLKTEINNLLAYFTIIKASDKVMFFRLLATMINAGIAIVRALRILEEQMENPRFKKIVGEIAEKIENGERFSQALGDYSSVFSEAQIGMITAGEASGRLNQTLKELAVEAEKSASLTSKIKGAMIYPVVVILILVAAGFAVMTLVMPKIKEMFESLGGELPTATKALIAVSDFMVGKSLGLPNALWGVIGLFGFVFLVMGWKKTAGGRIVWARFLLALPVIGKLSQKVALARFCRGLSTLITSGVSIIKALRITASSVGNALYEKRIHRIADDVKQGITMGENMKDDEQYFPPMLVGMISVAEQTAQIDTITDKLGGFYEEQVDDMVKNLTSLMEPIIIVVLGLAVAFLVIAVMLPILQSSDLASSTV